MNSRIGIGSVWIMFPIKLFTQNNDKIDWFYDKSRFQKVNAKVSMVFYLYIKIFTRMKKKIEVSDSEGCKKKKP